MSCTVATEFRTLLRYWLQRRATLQKWRHSVNYWFQFAHWRVSIRAKNTTYLFTYLLTVIASVAEQYAEWVTWHLVGNVTWVRDHKYSAGAQHLGTSLLQTLRNISVFQRIFLSWRDSIIRTTKCSHVWSQLGCYWPWPFYPFPPSQSEGTVNKYLVLCILLFVLCLMLP